MNSLDQRNWVSEARDDIGERVVSLGRNVAAMSHDAGRNGQKMATRYGRQLQRSAGDLADGVMQGGVAVAHEVGRQAQRVGRVVRNDPLPVIAVAVAVACVAGVLISRRR
jgi:ElaB/YqjD/DUF883 family membrane-anchored ribosome-binding protein